MKEDIKIRIVGLLLMMPFIAYIHPLYIMFVKPTSTTPILEIVNSLGGIGVVLFAIGFWLSVPLFVHGLSVHGGVE